MATTKQGAPWWLPILIALLSLVISGYVGYSANNQDVTGRLATLEAHRENDSPRLSRIEAKVDAVDDKVDALKNLILSVLKDAK